MTSKVYKIKIFRHAITTKVIPAGQTIFSKDEPGQTMYAIKSGKVGVVIDGKTVDYIGPDQVFGEMALLEKMPRSATVVAVEETVLAEIDEKQFLTTVQQNPYFALDLLRTISARLRASHHHLV